MVCLLGQRYLACGDFSKYDKMIRGENERMCSIYNRTICYTYTCNKTTHILLTSCTCNINIKSHLYWIYTHNEYTSNRYIISLCMQSSIQKVLEKIFILITYINMRIESLSTPAQIL